MKNIYKFIALIGFTFLLQPLSSQKTVTLTPSKDAYLYMTLKPGYEHYANTNYGTVPKFYSGEWSASGYRVNQRSLLDFDVASLPADAEILEARLSLYSMAPQLNDDYRHSSSIILRPNLSFKSNASYLERITNPWTEYAVTYSTQPATSTLNRVVLPESETYDESYVDYNVTPMIRDMFNNPGSSYGMMIRLTTESKYSRMAFCSREHTDTIRWPRLIVTYKISDRISTFYHHSFILRTDGTLWAWGGNINGELGDGTIVNKSTPVQIPGTDWKQVSAGYNHTLAIKADGSLWAWGFNLIGQLGDGTNIEKHSPVKIGADNNWRQISAGYNFSFAIKTDGTLWAWGYNDKGQLGDNTTYTAYAPKQIGTSSDWKMVVARKNYVLALKNDSTLWAWGNNDFGQLGDGTKIEKHSPVQVGTDKNWKTVSAGWDHALAIKGNGTLWGWGNNNYAQGGDSLRHVQVSPLPIGTAQDWKEVSAGFQHSMALKTDGSVYVWGYNYYGQLGDGTTGSVEQTVTRVNGMNNVAHLGAGWCYSVVLNTDGTYCGAGMNSVGQLGNGSIVNASTFGCLGTSNELKSTADPMMPEAPGVRRSSIGQNYPNPVNNYTVVDCYLDENAADARVVVYNISHMALKQYPVETQGVSHITLGLQDLSAGMYFYTLEIGGTVVDEKKLILIK